MKKFGGRGFLKKACKKRSCDQLVDPRRAVAAYNDNPTLSFDPKLTAEEIFKQAWCSAAEHTEEGAHLLWSTWQAKQSKLTKQVEEEINVESFGFAATRRHTPFPAILLSSKLGSGSLKVRYFGTGEVGLIAESNWTQYSEEKCLELEGDATFNRGGFSAALGQMRAALAEVTRGEGGEEIPQGYVAAQSTDIPRSSVAAYNKDHVQVLRGLESKGRNLLPLTARSLADDELFNSNAFASKMVWTDHSFWKCKNCPHLKIKVKIEAKRHARRCGERPRWPRKSSTVSRHQCSACPEKFKSKKVLISHYSTCHRDRRRAYKCTVCQTDILAWKNLRRHMREKHGQRSWLCKSCPKVFDRITNLLRHQKKKHPRKENFLTPILKRTQALIADLVVRREAGPLSQLEENRLENLLLQREMLARQEGEENEREESIPATAVRRKRPSDGHAAPILRKSARLQVMG